MTIEVRPAHDGDLEFLVWTMMTAGQSHLEWTVWEKMFGRDADWVADLMRRGAVSAQPHWCHLSKFWIAEIDGQPAGAMSSFDPETEGNDALTAALLPAAMELGLGEAEIGGMIERAAIIEGASPKSYANSWGAENVAVHPAFRGRGVTERLFECVLEQGRQAGRDHAQILCLNGNERALKAWARNDFELRADYRSDACEQTYGTAGLKLLTRRL